MGFRQSFGDVVPERVLADWRRAGCGMQVIGQAELAPIAIALQLWGSRLQGREVLFFVDNDSAKDSMIRGYSPSLASARIIGAAWEEIARLQANCWFEHVPGVSNIADGPSRLDFALAAEVGAARVHLAGEVWSSLCVGSAGS